MGGSQSRQEREVDSSDDLTTSPSEAMRFLIENFRFSEHHLIRRRNCSHDIDRRRNDDTYQEIGDTWTRQQKFWTDNVANAKEPAEDGDASVRIKGWYAICSDASDQRDLRASPNEIIKCYVMYYHARYSDTYIEQLQIFVGREALKYPHSNRGDISQVCYNRGAGGRYFELTAPESEGTYMIWYKTSLEDNFDDAAKGSCATVPPERQFIAWLRVTTEDLPKNVIPAPPVFFLRQDETPKSAFLLDAEIEAGNEASLGQFKRFLEFDNVLNMEYFESLMESARQQDTIQTLLDICLKDKDKVLQQDEDGYCIFHYFLRNPLCADAIMTLLGKFPTLVEDVENLPVMDEETGKRDTVLHHAFEANQPVELIRQLLGCNGAREQLKTTNKVGLIPADLASQDLLNGLFPDHHSTCAVIDSASHGADRLGYRIYAQALVHVAGLAERSDTSFCVGIYSQWGGGKSFLWRMIQQQVEARFLEEDVATIHEIIQREGISTGYKNILDNTVTALRSSNYVDPNVIEWAGVIQAETRAQAGEDADDIEAQDGGDDGTSDRRKWWDIKGRTDDLVTVVSEIELEDLGICRGALISLFLLFQRTLDLFLIMFKKVSTSIRRLDEVQRNPPIGAVKQLKVEFNAWLYQGSDMLWASLIKKLWDVVEQEFGVTKVRLHRASIKLSKEKARDTLEEKLKKRKLALIRYKSDIYLAMLVAILGAVATAILLSKRGGAAKDTKGVIKGTNETSTTGIEVESLDDESASTENFIDEFLAPVVSTIIFVTPLLYGARKYYKYVRPYLQQARGDFIVQKTMEIAQVQGRRDFSPEVGFMGEVKKEIEYLFDFLRTTPLRDNVTGVRRYARLCVFIDDLDRCPSSVVVRVLEAVTLLLVDAPVTCWLAIDGRSVVSSIENEYKSMTNANISGYEFMDKIVQLPFSISSIDDRKKSSFLSKIVESSEMDPERLRIRLSKLQSITLDGVNAFREEVGKERVINSEILEMTEQQQFVEQTRLLFDAGIFVSRPERCAMLGMTELELLESGQLLLDGKEYKNTVDYENAAVMVLEELRRWDTGERRKEILHHFETALSGFEELEAGLTMSKLHAFFRRFQDLSKSSQLFFRELVHVIGRRDNIKTALMSLNEFLTWKEEHLNCLILGDGEGSEDPEGNITKDTLPKMIRILEQIGPEVYDALKPESSKSFSLLMSILKSKNDDDPFKRIVIGAMELERINFMSQEKQHSQGEDDDRLVSIDELRRSNLLLSDSQGQQWVEPKEYELWKRHLCIHDIYDRMTSVEMDAEDKFGTISIEDIVDCTGFASSDDDDDYVIEERNKLIENLKSRGEEYRMGILLLLGRIGYADGNRRESIGCSIGVGTEDVDIVVRPLRFKSNSLQPIKNVPGQNVPESKSWEQPQRRRSTLPRNRLSGVYRNVDQKNYRTSQTTIAAAKSDDDDDVNNNNNKKQSQDVKPNNGIRALTEQIGGQIYRPMLSATERGTLDKFIPYLGGNPRKLKRIMNVYSVCRRTVELTIPSWTTLESSFMTKLLKFIIMLEQWPYRTAWLLQMMEDLEQVPNALLSTTTTSSSRRSTTTTANDDNTNGRNCPIHECNSELIKILDFLKRRAEENMYDGRSSSSSIIMANNDSDDIQERVYNLSAAEIFATVVQRLIYSPNHASKYLALDYDPKNFENLLMEGPAITWNDLRLPTLNMPLLQHQQLLRLYTFNEKSAVSTAVVRMMDECFPKLVDSPTSSNTMAPITDDENNNNTTNNNSEDVNNTGSIGNITTTTTNTWKTVLYHNKGTFYSN